MAYEFNYLKLLDKTANISYLDIGESFERQSLEPQPSINIVVKNVLDVRGKLPDNIQSMQDVPDFIVSSNGILQITYLNSISKSFSRPVNKSESENIYNNAIKIYCLQTRSAQTSDSIRRNLKVLLASLIKYFELKGKSTNIFEYYTDIEFAKFSKNLSLLSNTELTLYKSDTDSYTNFWLKAPKESGNIDTTPTSILDLVSLSLVAEFVDRLMKYLKLSKDYCCITSTYRTMEKQRQIYEKKGLTPVYTSFHLYGMAIDFTLTKDGKKAMKSNDVATHIVDKNQRSRIAPLREIIRETSSDDIGKIFENDDGWIHVAVGPRARIPYDSSECKALEHPGYFETLIKEAKGLALASKIANISDLEVPDVFALQDIKRKMTIDMALGMAQTEESYQISKPFIALSMIKSGSATSFYKAQEKYISKSIISILDDIAITRASKDILLTIEKIKAESYSNLSKPRKIYNYDRDEWVDNA